MTPPVRTDWPAVLLAVGAGVAAAFQVGKAPIALPFIRAELGLDLSAASWILSMLALMGAIAGGAMGSVVTRLGPRRLLPAGLALIAFGSLAGGLAPSQGFLLASRVAEGIGLTVVVIAAPALITVATSPQDRHTAFGLWACFMPFGMAVSMMAAPLLPLIGWRGLWLGMAAFLACYALLAWIRLPASTGHGGSSPSRLWHDLLRTVSSPGPVLLAVIFACYTTAYIALTGFLPTLLIERMGVTPGQAGMMTAAVAAANIVGNLATGPLLRWGVPRWVPIILANITIAASAIGIFSPATPVPLAYALCLVFSAVGGLLPGCVLGGAPPYAPDSRLVPVTLGLIMQGSNIGQVTGPVVVGAAVAWWGWSAAAPLLAGVTLTGAALTLVLRRVRLPG
ncbi:MFS transporter [Magnetospirillum molischianum]|nr:MFS transporter [Magnetospirillum molischianum]